MRGKQDRLPVRALVAFAVTQQAEDARITLHRARRDCHSGRYGHAMPEQTNREFHARHCVTDMPGQARSVAAIGVKLLGWEKNLVRRGPHRGSRRHGPCSR